MKNVWKLNQSIDKMDFWDFHNLLEECSNGLEKAYCIAQEQVYDNEYCNDEKFMVLLATYIYEMAEQDRIFKKRLKGTSLKFMSEYIERMINGFGIGNIRNYGRNVMKILKANLYNKDYQYIVEWLNGVSLISV